GIEPSRQSPGQRPDRLPVHPLRRPAKGSPPQLRRGGPAGDRRPAGRALRRRDRCPGPPGRHRPVRRRHEGRIGQRRPCHPLARLGRLGAGRL
ncbi:MAG: D-aminoacyl-tRNA deacylase, partial [uncultured Thermomicrobiales bacterium]